MTAWQYFAGAGLVAALCPLHGHVAVAGDGPGRGARVDLCVPAGQPKRPGVPPSGRPSVRVAVPGADAGLTVRHPGWAPRPGRPAVVLPGPSEPSAAAGPAKPSAEAEAEAVAAPAEPPPAPGPGAAAGPAPAEAPAAPRAGAAAAPVSAFRVRPYRAVAVERRGPGGMSTVMLMVVVTTPAVLAAAALRPRSKSRG
ncbi:hypothetical protein NRK68_28380 [Streptomyces yangpuensis]|uniref:Uncharacterized protein n=1 Tax=Streptomyces yangpuensis TaxID=1648182 RepID=A0ABY5Q3Q8_9ACTN|nr:MULTISPECIES: hypothetical protein [Streptomyces]MBZ9599037.1 hypothetical protein [Streptomyces erythrochromogenes]UUY50807.1 hypothetical protein NRK68_28380 [Streptomyces yangpuensis]